MRAHRKVAEKLIAKGRMKEAGLACIEAAKGNGRWDSAYSSLTPPKIPEDLEVALRNIGAFKRSTSMSNSSQLQFIFWINQAKRPVSRAKRINEIVGKVSP